MLILKARYSKMESLTAGKKSVYRYIPTLIAGEECVFWRVCQERREFVFCYVYLINKIFAVPNNQNG